MNIVLYKDTYDIIKIPKKQYNDVSAIAYLFDISTERKGPIFTIVKNPINKINSEIITIAMNVSYAPIDIPFCDSVMFNSCINIASIESYYNIYPLIKQMISFNSFIETYSYYITNQLVINDIMIHYGTTNIQLDEFCSDKKIKKTFKYLSMLTNVSDFMNTNKYIVFYKNGIWKVCDDVDSSDKSIKYIFVVINDTECGYLFTRKEFKIIKSIDELNITLRYNLKTLNELESVYDEVYSVYDMDVQFDTFDGILAALMFIPQLLLIEKHIYSDFIDLDLIINVDDLPKLMVTDHEMKCKETNACLFTLIRDLIKFKL